MRQAAFDIFTMVEMAFGTWLKGLISTVGSAVKKALPIAKKVVDTVAPMAQQVGGLIGGKSRYIMTKSGVSCLDAVFRHYEAQPPATN